MTIPERPEQSEKLSNYYKYILTCSTPSCKRKYGSDKFKDNDRCPYCDQGKVKRQHTAALRKSFLNHQKKHQSKPDEFADFNLPLKTDTHKIKYW